MDHTDLESALFSAVTGIETSEAELDLIGERLKNLQRAILIRNQRRERNQEVKEVLRWYTRPDGNTGTEVDPVQFNRLVDTYYRLRGWDAMTGWPSASKLAELGLTDVAAELATLGLLPPR
jgi:aldehyde:ferredoxin oxidoreductase